MALINDKLGPETSASAILNRDASIYTSSIAAGTIVETLEEDGFLLYKQRDLAAYRALYASRSSIVPKALNGTKEQVG